MAYTFAQSDCDNLSRILAKARQAAPHLALSTEYEQYAKGAKYQHCVRVFVHIIVAGAHQHLDAAVDFESDNAVVDYPVSYVCVTLLKELCEQLQKKLRQQVATQPEWNAAGVADLHIWRAVAALQVEIDNWPRKTESEDGSEHSGG